MNAITTNRLNDIAAAVNTEHVLFENAMRESLAHAVKAGELLTEAKQLVSHGEWLKWITDNCQFGERSAQNYMRIYSRFPELAKAQHVADLTYREAVGLLTEPKPESKPITELTEEEAVHEFLGIDPAEYRAWKAAGHPTKEELEESDRIHDMIVDDMIAFSKCNSPRARHRLALKRLAEYTKKGALIRVNSGIPGHVKIADDVSFGDEWIVRHAIGVYMFPKVPEE